MEQKYYVYEWFNIDNNEIFYVGKGCNNRYKSLSHRNKYFKEYIQNNNVDVRIVKYFESEEEAYKYEKELTDSYRKIGQCKCCLVDGGYGGYSSIWNDEARKYMSENNPMKDINQRERMSKNNPMKDKEIAMLVASKQKKKIVVDNEIYDGLVDVAKSYGKSNTLINYWLNRGYTSDHKVIYYYGEEKPIVNEKINNTCGKGILIDGIFFRNMTVGAKYLGCTNANISYLLKHSDGIYNGHKIEYANTPDKETIK